MGRGGRLAHRDVRARYEVRSYLFVLRYFCCNATSRNGISMKDFPSSALAVRLEVLRGLVKVLDRLTWRERQELQYATRKSQRPQCGARCRDGHPCRAPAIWDKVNDRPRNGRCRLHGGLSTGPKTLEGRLKALLNLKQFKSNDTATASPI